MTSVFVQLWEWCGGLHGNGDGAEIPPIPREIRPGIGTDVAGMLRGWNWKLWESRAGGICFCGKPAGALEKSC